MEHVDLGLLLHFIAIGTFGSYAELGMLEGCLQERKGLAFRRQGTDLGVLYFPGRMTRTFFCEERIAQKKENEYCRYATVQGRMAATELRFTVVFHVR